MAHVPAHPRGGHRAGGRLRARRRQRPLLGLVAQRAAAFYLRDAAIPDPELWVCGRRERTGGPRCRQGPALQLSRHNHWRARGAALARRRPGAGTAARQDHVDSGAGLAAHDRVVRGVRGGAETAVARADADHGPAAAAAVAAATSAAADVSAAAALGRRPGHGCKMTTTLALRRASLAASEAPPVSLGCSNLAGATGKRAPYGAARQSSPARRLVINRD